MQQRHAAGRARADWRTPGAADCRDTFPGERRCIYVACGLNLLLASGPALQLLSGCRCQSLEPAPACSFMPSVVHHCPALPATRVQDGADVAVPAPTQISTRVSLLDWMTRAEGEAPPESVAKAAAETEHAQLPLALTTAMLSGGGGRRRLSATAILANGIPVAALADDDDSAAQLGALLGGAALTLAASAGAARWAAIRRRRLKRSGSISLSLPILYGAHQLDDAEKGH